MSATIAITIAMGCLFGVGMVALVDASFLARRWRIGPILLCSSSAFWLVDRLLFLADLGTSVEQTPWRPYLPALVVMGCAITIAGLLARLPRKTAAPQPRGQLSGVHH